MGDENLVKDDARIFSPKIGRKSNLASATNQTASNYASFGKNESDINDVTKSDIRGKRFSDNIKLA